MLGTHDEVRREYFDTSGRAVGPSSDPTPDAPAARASSTIHVVSADHGRRCVAYGSPLESRSSGRGDATSKSRCSATGSGEASLMGAILSMTSGKARHNFWIISATATSS